MPKTTPDALAATYAVAFPNARPWSRDEFADLCADPAVILCGDASSFILGRVVLDEAEVLTIATQPQMRRQGLANAALAAFQLAVQARHATTVLLEVAADNKAAISLYSKAKFTQVGRRPRYYVSTDGQKTDALILRCDLITD